MDPLQEQVKALTSRIDVLYQAIERMNVKLAAALSDPNLAATASNHAHSRLKNSHQKSSGSNRISHKHVLADEDPLDVPLRDKKLLAPEVQIQVLTAQLTVAYNRIAALEEQLMAYRSTDLS